MSTWGPQFPPGISKSHGYTTYWRNVLAGIMAVRCDNCGVDIGVVPTEGRSPRDVSAAIDYLTLDHEFQPLGATA